jgi:hypothetical protein
VVTLLADDDIERICLSAHLRTLANPRKPEPGWCRVCGEKLPDGEVICVQHEREEAG